jgi:hypothetical protein
MSEERKPSLLTDEERERLAKQSPEIEKFMAEEKARVDAQNQAAEDAYLANRERQRQLKLEADIQLVQQIEQGKRGERAARAPELLEQTLEIQRQAIEIQQQTQEHASGLRQILMAIQQIVELFWKKLRRGNKKGGVAARSVFEKKRMAKIYRATEEGLEGKPYCGRVDGLECRPKQEWLDQGLAGYLL